MDKLIGNKLVLYQATAIFSMLFALVGFSYNVWRMEVSEENNNIRTACFEMLLELSSLEQLLYTAHFDKNLQEASPRKGWVKVGLINELAILTNHSVRQEAQRLKTVWSGHWEHIENNRQSVDLLVQSIDDVRMEIKSLLQSLK